MRSKTSIIAIAVLTMVLLTIGSILPAMAAATGTIIVNKSFVSPTGSVTVTVTDADLNDDADAKQDVTFTGNGALATQTVTLALAIGESISGTPVVIDNTTGATLADGTTATANTTDVDESSNFKVTVFDAATGTVTIQTFADADGKDGDTDTTSGVVSYPITVFYYKGKADTTTVKVTSTQDSTGITLTLTESATATATAISSGVFKGTFSVQAGSSSGTAIQAVAGQVITIKYTDADPVGTRSAQVTVEGSDPTIVLVSPAHNSFNTSLTPKLSVDVTDGDSAVSTASGDILFSIQSITSTGVATITLGAITTTAITNGFRVDVTASGFPDNQTTKITWRVTAKDKAGNEGQSDSDATTVGKQDYTLIVDRLAPNYAGSTANVGQWWDTSLLIGTVKNGTQTTATKSKNTSIAIVLPDILTDEKDAIDGTTVSTTDFELDTFKNADGTTVNDVIPTAVNVYPGAGNTIFLTVPAMAADAKPMITLKSGISDTAGNTIATGAAGTVLDKQAPALTLVTAATQLLTKAGEVQFTSNEVLNAQSAEINGTTATVTLVGTNEWKVASSGTTGVYAFVVTGTDGGGNTRTIGNVITTTAFPTTSSVVVYVDSAKTPNPAVLGGGKATFSTTTTIGASDQVEVTEPFFVTFDFVDEGKEYGLDTSSAPTNVISSVKAGTDLDAHNKVTLTKLTLDGVDVLSQATTTNSVTYTLAVTNIALGDHTVVVNATDEAGNTLNADVSKKFKVKARSAYSLGLTAGWNLVSLPGDPVDGSLGTVLSSSRITQVLTYDPKDANGPWLVATRASDGSWSAASTITAIDSLHAYWINTSGGETVQPLLKLVAVGTGATPPTVSVAAGWNLVPVIDLRQRSVGTTIDSAAYLTSISWKVAYTYDPADSVGPWVRILPSTSSTTTNVKIGKGYWVWATAVGTLVP